MNCGFLSYRDSVEYLYCVKINISFSGVGCFYAEISGKMILSNKVGIKNNAVTFLLLN